MDVSPHRASIRGSLHVTNVNTGRSNPLWTIIRLDATDVHRVTYQCQGQNDADDEEYGNEECAATKSAYAPPAPALSDRPSHLLSTSTYAVRSKLTFVHI